jgi:hypothetical protein
MAVPASPVVLREPSVRGTASRLQSAGTLQASPRLPRPRSFPLPSPPRPLPSAASSASFPSVRVLLQPSPAQSPARPFPAVAPLIINPPPPTLLPSQQVALSIAFNTASRLAWMHVVDFFGSLVYIADLLLGFHIGFLARWDGRATVVRGEHTPRAPSCCCPCARRGDAVGLTLMQGQWAKASRPLWPPGKSSGSAAAAHPPTCGTPAR